MVSREYKPINKFRKAGVFCHSNFLRNPTKNIASILQELPSMKIKDTAYILSFRLYDHLFSHTKTMNTAILLTFKRYF